MVLDDDSFVPATSSAGRLSEQKYTKLTRQGWCRLSKSVSRVLRLISEGFREYRNQGSKQLTSEIQEIKELENQ